MIEANELSTDELQQHEVWMRAALEEAAKAEAIGEVPIGAVIVKDGEIIARGHNVRETAQDALGHAEIKAIKAANQTLEAWRLEGASMYITLEPCPMCSGALINARVEQVIYGASDLKAGCAGTLMNLLEDTRFNHQVKVVRGVLAEECGAVLTNFFRQLRERNRQRKLSTKGKTDE